MHARKESKARTFDHACSVHAEHTCTRHSDAGKKTSSSGLLVEQLADVQHRSPLHGQLAELLAHSPSPLYAHIMSLYARALYSTRRDDASSELRSPR
jgi:hypothetical protein